MASICIVDDSAFARKQVRRYLESAGHDVFEAESGTKAIEIGKATPPDIFTLDLLMPGLTGQETLAAFICHADF